MIYGVVKCAFLEKDLRDRPNEAKLSSLRFANFFDLVFC